MDLAAEIITEYREPAAGVYSRVFTAQGAEQLSPQAFPDFVLTADQILG